ncbi:hypothetical protein Lalb_Chr01g0009601 [Lupinus albus]|uniref:WAT1-related protein n=1 Tax=Lupinus albus TaxID=3870 RepID=A0A6A4R272_LUPAL|nr:hypothetical protein Lalb_Chr01g0009601 [Lupinus albus]
MKIIEGCMMSFERNKPYVAMIFIQFVYSGMALLSKAAISKGMSSYVFVVYRQAFATLALSPFAYFDRLTASSNLYYVSINYTTATFAAAATNTVPSITFIMAVFISFYLVKVVSGKHRVESISINHIHGVAKILGSIISLVGAITLALVKGPSLLPENQKYISQSLTMVHSKGDYIKGSLMMLSANTSWSLWLILQGFIVKQYPAKFRLTAIQCFFSFIQSATLAATMERNLSAWRLGWDIHLLAVAYCVCLCL